MEVEIDGKRKKENVPINVRMEKSIYDKLTRFCEDTGQSKTVAVEKAIEMYVDDCMYRNGGCRRLWSVPC